MPSKKKSAPKRKSGAVKTPLKKKAALPKKTASKSTETKRDAKPAKPAGKSGTSKRTRASGASERRNVVPWAERFKDAPGPWTCPKCGPLPQRAQPLYGEDEKHHCPNVECDAVVTLLSKEDLEPAERRGSWPPQRNKQRALGEGGLGGPTPPADMEPAD